MAEQQKQTVKKWREKDKQLLYERIRERYLQLIKLRINIVNVEPMRKVMMMQERLSKKRDNQQRLEEKKRSRKLLQKRKEEAKAQTRQGAAGLRTGLRMRDAK